MVSAAGVPCGHDVVRSGDSDTFVPSGYPDQRRVRAVRGHIRWPRPLRRAGKASES
jgi:hypothetical protein